MQLQFHHLHKSHAVIGIKPCQCDRCNHRDSVQETIEIEKVAVNGIFEVSKNRYSKCYRFHDINYTTTNEEEQIDIFVFIFVIDRNLKCTVKAVKELAVSLKNVDLLLLIRCSIVDIVGSVRADRELNRRDT